MIFYAVLIIGMFVMMFVMMTSLSPWANISNKIYPVLITYVPTLAQFLLCKKFEGRLVKNAVDVFYIENGFKRYVNYENYVVSGGNNFGSEIDPVILANIPRGPDFVAISIAATGDCSKITGRTFDNSTTYNPVNTNVTAVNGRCIKVL